METKELIEAMMLELERLETCAEPYGGCSPEEELIAAAKEWLKDNS